MLKDRRPTDAADYAPRVRRRKLLTKMIIEAAERSHNRRNRVVMYHGKTIGRCAAPIGAPRDQFLAFVAWEEAWLNALKEERKCLSSRSPKSEHPSPKLLKSYPVGSRNSRRGFGQTP